MTLSSVQAVRLENFAYKDWLAGLSQHLSSRYPGGKFLYHRPEVVICLLNTSAPWGRNDEAFFAELKAQAFFQRWEPLAEVPPAPRANSAVYEDIGYRVGAGIRLTPTQQEAIFSQLGDLELRANAAEREAAEQRNSAAYLTTSYDRLVTRYNFLVALLEGINEELGITVNGEYDEVPTIEDRSTGQILMRDTSLDQVYRQLLSRQQRGQK